MEVIITPDHLTMSKRYESPLSKNELRYLMSLMQNDTTATGKGATYAKLEILLSQHGR
tara:strand:+ start:471 stop:644 length:174 start_codon:yes stop_codon:yes gene_type:complete